MSATVCGCNHGIEAHTPLGCGVMGCGCVRARSALERFRRPAPNARVDVGDAEIERLRAGLEVIAGERCTVFTRPQWGCLEDPNRFADAEYGADQMCDQCIAHAVLAGIPLRTQSSIRDNLHESETP